jgi:CheY-like chemotaxis protein
MSALILVVGDFSAMEHETIQRAVTRAGLVPAFVPSASRAIPKIRSAAAVLVDVRADASSLVDAIRDDVALFAMPVLVLADAPSSDTWRSAYADGADDIVLKHDSEGLMRRLHLLASTPPPPRPEAALGRAIVASSNEASRRRVGRTLRSAGFDVSFAASWMDVAADLNGAGRPAFVVSTEQAPGEATREGVAYVNGVPVLFLGSGEDHSAGAVHHRVADATARVLFFADEQARARFQDRRSSARKLWAHVCSFRTAGTLEPVYGITHNVSREGLYVRTFDPPAAQSKLWVELHAPGTDTLVHLRAQAMWRKLPRTGTGALPPGFGLRIDAGASLG